MGCDIHAFVEYRINGQPNWRSWGSEFRLSRYYALFAKFCGVRNSYNIIPIAAPRGLPDDIGYAAKSKNFIFIVEKTAGESGWCTLETAQEYVKIGARMTMDSAGKPLWVTNPDLHSHTWLTTFELYEALNDPAIGSTEGAVEYWALAVAMQSFYMRGAESRLILSFDN